MQDSCCHPTPQPPLLWPPQVHALLSVICQVRPGIIKYPSFLHPFAAHPLTPPSPTTEPGTLQATVREGRRVGNPGEAPWEPRLWGCTSPPTRLRLVIDGLIISKPFPIGTSPPTHRAAQRRVGLAQGQDVGGPTYPGRWTPNGQMEGEVTPLSRTSFSVTSPQVSFSLYYPYPPFGSPPHKPHPLPSLPFSPGLE